jgi:hypothetical protein
MAAGYLAWGALKGRRHGLTVELPQLIGVTLTLLKGAGLVYWSDRVLGEMNKLAGQAAGVIGWGGCVAGGVYLVPQFRRQMGTGFSPVDPAAYLHIINILKSNNNLTVTYLGANGDSTWSPGIASRTNVLEFTTGTADGSYSSNNFASTGQTNILSGGTGLGVVTNMIDAGGATNQPARYYRIEVIAP